MIVFGFGQIKLQRFCKYLFDLNGYVITKYFRKLFSNNLFYC